MSALDPLAIRAALGREQWSPGTRFGPDGWRFDQLGGLDPRRVIVSDGPGVVGSDEEYRHASISGLLTVPTYADLALLHRAVWGRTGWSCQVFVPAAEHVNIHPRCLHLWGRDLLRAVVGPVSDAQADYLLWECTPFPMLQGAALVPDLRRLARSRWSRDLRRAARRRATS